jgi:DNA-binding CsgD family transcriptional regulator/Tfp pilus assembly protein PilF
MYELVGQFDRAHVDYELVLQAAQQTVDRHSEWQTLLALGFLWQARDLPHARDYFQQALELAHTMGEPAILARSLNRMGNWHVNMGQALEAQAFHGQALEIFEELNDQPGLAETLDLLGSASYMAGDFVEGTRYYQRAIPIFRTLNDRRSLASALTQVGLGGRVDTEVMGAELGEVARCAEEALSLARTIGWRSGEVHALIELGSSLAQQGDYTRGLSLIEAGAAMAVEIEHRIWTLNAWMTLAMVYRDLLDLERAAHYLQQTLTLAQERASPIWQMLMPLLDLVRIEMDRAAVPQTSFDRQALAHVPQLMPQRRAWFQQAELASARGDAQLALEIADALIASIPHLEAGRVVPNLWKLRGEALAGLRRFDEAQTVLQAARDATEAEGRRPLLWRIHLALGKLYLAQKRNAEAEQALDNARRVSEALVMPDELCERFRQRAAEKFPAMRAATPRQSAKKAFGGLTEREREVAALIAHGKSNRDIAQTLNMSERTVANHVGNILSKLGFRSRTQVAAWAIEKGLHRSRSA